MDIKQKIYTCSYLSVEFITKSLYLYVHFNRYYKIIKTFSGNIKHN